MQRLVVLFTILFAPFILIQEALSQPKLETISLQISGHILKAEVANTSASRRQGLMNRRMLSKNSGMLFVFPQPGRYSMWMKDTYIPLSVAFINAQGVILNIEKMQPLSETVHHSIGLAKYALEMNASWFAEKNVVAGDRVEGLDSN